MTSILQISDTHLASVLSTPETRTPSAGELSLETLEFLEQHDYALRPGYQALYSNVQMTMEANFNIMKALNMQIKQLEKCILQLGVNTNVMAGE